LQAVIDSHPPMIGETDQPTPLWGAIIIGAASQLHKLLLPANPQPGLDDRPHYQRGKRARFRLGITARSRSSFNLLPYAIHDWWQPGKPEPRRPSKRALSAHIGCRSFAMSASDARCAVQSSADTCGGKGRWRVLTIARMIDRRAVGRARPGGRSIDLLLTLRKPRFCGRAISTGASQ
jgi:hypothetical protein